MTQVMVFEHGSEEEDSTNDPTQDESFPYSVFQSFLNPSAPKKSTRIFNPYEIWGGLADAAKQMIIEYNKKVKVTSPKPYLNGGKPKPNPTLGKLNSTPQQVHTHEQDDHTVHQPPETATQTMVHECLAENGTDPSDIQNVMSIINAKGAIHHKIPQGSFKFTKDMSLPELINLPTI